MIRKMRIDDVAAIWDIDQERLKTKWNKTLYKQELLDLNTISYVYERQGRVVGYIMCKYIGETSDILQIAVLEQFDGQGIATKLFNQAWYDLQQLGSKEILLEVYEKNQAAVGFYEHLGFKKIYMRKNYYGMRKHAFVMRLRLE